MTPETVATGWLMVAGALIFLGVGVIWFVRSELAEQRAERAHLAGVARSLMPCMTSRSHDTPLICTRTHGHPGHHIAYGNRDRVIATWPRESVYNVEELGL